MNKSFFYWLPIAALALGAFACQTDDNTPETSSDPRGEEYTITTPAEISDSRAMELTASHQQFASNLASELAQPGGNMVISPLSMYNFMAMMANGADGKTLEQILKVVGAKNSEEVVALCRRQLNSFAAIEAKNQEFPIPDFSNDPIYEFFTEEQKEEIIKDLMSCFTQTALANSIWYDSNHVGTPYQSYLDECKQWLNADSKLLDFSDPTSSMQINQWVNNATKGLISHIVPTYYPITTEIVCVNALYLNIKWTYGFDVADEKLDFKNSDGSLSKVSALKQTKTYAYSETSDAHIIDIPLGSFEEQMTYTIILPKGDGADAAAMLPLAAQGFNSQTQQAYIALTMPEFEVETDLTEGIRNNLENLGMIDAFDKEKANFTRMGAFKFKVFDVVHRANIHVCESGIEAAASTANIWCSSPGPDYRPPQPIKITVDRPFAFRITDNATGMVLFIGTVNRL
ncbi:MAG: hypothetical protein K2G15_07190 [Muribaculaceae bacterium]|nr:hypothetical protein [Muribaculaceae bacterium]